MTMFKRRNLALLATVALLIAACGGGDAATTTAGEVTETTAAPATSAAGAATTSPPGDDDEIIVGVSWNNYNEERWAKSDEPNIVAALEEAGATYISADAGSSAEQQLADVENLMAQGADVLIILAQDGEAILPAVASALEQGVPVIAYDRLIENPGALYITFDNIGVGRLQAEVIYGLVPEGNYAIIKGNQADANADFLREGYTQVIGDAESSGAINVACETYTDNWDPAIAQTNMEQCLTQENNAIDAVLSENDGMAGGVVAALEAQGLAGTVPVSGQDGDLAALNRVALGTQSVSVWKDARELGRAAGEAAIQLAQGAAIEDVAGVVQFDSPGGNSMTSILLEPIAITQDNLDVVVDAEWITVDQLCQGVAAGAVAVCP
ncbi:MAG TPA: substrate-binding domain-containing protein [Acidimicrobiia bacterium]|jgi:D-xylose transport system substrate-binding protein|nr:substrate-binding domain-containing protein [Acidimicrobiia bacterium]